ncbi:hypothetical protein [Streptomyces boluensis]|uniref:Lipoprotein n=1 Tax=Streptomyces boluensis TaxID=1775135 RepID=A0A964UQL6_9ACTN|nr:hypothetical protein [Streptomyces boluensis]NBE52696.1 hypothetical protein [Streptomyces boluensis]
MLRTHRRKAVLAAVALVASTTLLTACQDGGATGKKSDGAASSAQEKDKAGGDDSNTKAGGGKGVSGTWFGNVSYLAPGKYTVSDQKGTEQAFFTSTETDIQGAGEICGDAEGQAATPCTEEQLEAASKNGVSAEVKIEDGIAVSIVEDHASEGGGTDEEGDVTGGKKGVSGTWFGNVSYLAPGKYTVSDQKGTEQAFFTSTETDIQGAGEICGDAEGQAATPCTEEQLEAASKKGVSAEVKIEDGIAVSVVEDH